MKSLTVSTLAAAALIVGATGVSADVNQTLLPGVEQQLAAAGSDSSTIAGLVASGGEVSAEAATIISRGIGQGASATGIVSEVLAANPGMSVSQLSSLVEAASEAAFGDAAGVLTVVLEQTNTSAEDVATLAGAATAGVKKGCGDTCGAVIGNITAVATSDPSVEGDQAAIDGVAGAIDTALDTTAAPTQQAAVSDSSTAGIETGSTPETSDDGLSTSTTGGTGGGVFSNGATGASGGGGASGGASPS